MLPYRRVLELRVLDGRYLKEQIDNVEAPADEYREPQGVMGEHAKMDADRYEEEWDDEEWLGEVDGAFQPVHHRQRPRAVFTVALNISKVFAGDRSDKKDREDRADHPW